MSSPYSTLYTPPAPSLPVTFGLVGERPTFGPYDALVDSGADMTIVPRRLLVQWGIPSRFDARLRGQWDERRMVQLYLVDVQIGDVRLPSVYVAGDPEETEIILGRNILNKLPLLLDGPKEQTEVLDDATIKRLRSRR
jgi:predicted aspartyl protease